MKQLLGLTLALCLLLVPVWGTEAMAQEVGTSCTDITWDANTEPDLANYLLYVMKDNVAQPVKAFDKAITSTTCAENGIVAESENPTAYVLHLTAVDTSGNESLPSNVVEMSLRIADTTPPAAPANVCIDATVDDVPVKLCGNTGS
jgi:hypothetical protein